MWGQEADIVIIGSASQAQARPSRHRLVARVLMMKRIRGGGITKSRRPYRTYWIRTTPLIASRRLRSTTERDGGSLRTRTRAKPRVVAVWRRTYLRRNQAGFPPRLRGAFPHIEALRESVRDCT